MFTVISVFMTAGIGLNGDARSMILNATASKNRCPLLFCRLIDLT